MVHIDTTSSLESFRKFIIFSTCKSFNPSNYNKDPNMFPERDTRPGDIYIEAVDKLMERKLKEITFVNAKEILGIIYSWKTGNTILKWRQLKVKNGKVIGEASPNALANWVESGVLTKQGFEHLKSQTS
ncbi:hypothetical protein [Candidatus Nitrosocosmicus arcticus]|uniref:hypothetical protein n=1 Tax=Candidatus Nitrosocosmicus arcticus TaxID=2035267 RepID=UPI0011A5F66A